MSVLPRFSFRGSEQRTPRRQRGPPSNVRDHQATSGPSRAPSTPSVPPGPFQPLALPQPSAPPSTPVSGDFDGTCVCFGGGVAIFHLASARVVVCYHPRHRFWFLPKGRKDVDEEAGAGAEREGYEESGYRNRLLPLPVKHRQPAPASQGGVRPRFSTEPLYVQLMPLSTHDQYVLSWRIAETLPPEDETAMADEPAASASSPQTSVLPYRPPPAYPPGLTLRTRVAMDRTADGRPYEPVRHKDTGVDADELLYESHLLPVAEAIARLAGCGQDVVVWKGWEAICLRDCYEST